MDADGAPLSASSSIPAHAAYTHRLPPDDRVCCSDGWVDMMGGFQTEWVVPKPNRSSEGASIVKGSGVSVSMSPECARAWQRLQQTFDGDEGMLVVMVRGPADAWERSGTAIGDAADALDLEPRAVAPFTRLALTALGVRLRARDDKLFASPTPGHRRWRDGRRTALRKHTRARGRRGRYHVRGPVRRPGQRQTGPERCGSRPTGDATGRGRTEASDNRVKTVIRMATGSMM